MSRTIAFGVDRRVRDEAATAYRPSTSVGCCARPPRELADVRRAVAARPWRRSCAIVARHHQPSGMAVDDVLARGRQVDSARDQVDVDPRVHAQAGCVRPAEHRRERIEASGWRSSSGGARFDAAEEIGVAAPAHLHEQRVEAVIAGRLHQRGDAVGEVSEVRSTHIARISSAGSLLRWRTDRRDARDARRQRRTHATAGA